mmetsp:Transcript_7365/g.11085  ORF Transcript_7365/g.11085 Transcript_7365/m.11085 type:complete len:188 (-) Transcript_7365:39-602(-)
MFVKEIGDGPSKWHQDSAACPLNTDKFLTIWIPLFDLPPNGSSLRFASGSHHVYSDIIGDRHKEEQKAPPKPGYSHPSSPLLQACGFELTDTEEMKIGDVTIHSGWTFHSSPSNTTHFPRYALAVCLFADGEYVKKNVQYNILDDYPTVNRINRCGELIPSSPLCSRFTPIIGGTSTTSITQTPHFM